MMNSIKILSVTKKKRGLEIVKIFSKDETRLWLSKKSKRKQVKKRFGKKAVEIRGNNPCEKYAHARNEFLVYNSK